MSAATPPFLQSLSARAWQAFLEDWEAYRARGGRSPVRHCVSSTVLKVIELRLPKAHARVAAEREAKEESQKVDGSGDFSKIFRWCSAWRIYHEFECAKGGSASHW